MSSLSLERLPPLDAWWDFARCKKKEQVGLIATIATPTTSWVYLAIKVILVLVLRNVQGFLVENEKANETPAEFAQLQTQVVALYWGGLLEMILPAHVFLIQTLALDTMVPNTKVETVLAKALHVIT